VPGSKAATGTLAKAAATVRRFIFIILSPVCNGWLTMVAGWKEGTLEKGRAQASM
jgi:hypothetical protein